ncbi:hypothetical protein [Candidatus Magnetobacterium casense]|uniref:Uncharacterized protein n=1 Tax=Candidatus Magnetobacterium casense TaxID=1455061 RepID=A0ABS6S1J7_9BACT|nr:hypothetical protein [Candidatus Magnetobacterium casensis]MBV6342686.1 hypothetical protein [Candidatus Magnetobacterium casensis]
MPLTNTTPFWERQETNLPNGIAGLDNTGKLPVSILPLIGVDADTVDGKHASDIIVIGQTAINAEAVVRSTKDTMLENSLNAETTRATNIEGTLKSSIVVLQAGLTAETQIRQTADNSLITAIQTETGRATVVENSNAGAIAAEITRATTAENTLTTNVSGLVAGLIAETQTRQSEVDGISQSLSTETNRAMAAEATLTQAIATETGRATGVEGDLLNTLMGKATLVHVHTSSDVLDMNATLATFLNSQKGVVGGVASLGMDGKVLTSRQKWQRVNLKSKLKLLP